METSGEQTQDRAPLVKSLAICLGAWMLIWALTICGPLSLIVPIVVIASLVHFGRHRRYVTMAMFLMLTPFSLYFLLGSISYAAGDAVLFSVGLPMTTSRNLDPHWRCGRTATGCIALCNEWTTQAPNNFAVALLSEIFGPMPGTYTGPYPTEEEAKQAAEDASVVLEQELRNDYVSVGADVTLLELGVGTQLLDGLEYPESFWAEVVPELRGIIWKEECLILRIPVLKSSDPDRPSAAIALIDRSTGRPFAWYGEGEYYHHSPPVAWRRSRRGRGQNLRP